MKKTWGLEKLSNLFKLTQIVLVEPDLIPDLLTPKPCFLFAKLLQE